MVRAFRIVKIFFDFTLGKDPCRKGLFLFYDENQFHTF